MKNRSKLFLLLTFIVILAVAVAGCAGSKDPGSKTEEKVETAKPPETIRLTIASANAPEGASWTRNMDSFFTSEVSKRVEERTNYRINWNKAYAGSVAKVGEELNAVQKGLADVGMVVFPYEASKLPLHNFTYWVPFGPPDPVLLSEVIKQLFKEFPIFTEIFEKEYNQKHLGFGMIQNYNLVTKFPVETLTDIKNKKIAAVGPNLHFLNGSGAVPVQSAIPEMYTSFQTGVYEGWVMIPGSVLGMKIYEVAPYFNRGVDFGSILLSTININLDSWNKLPKEVQEIFMEVGQEFIGVQAKHEKDTEKAQIAEWEKQGGKVIDFKPEERVKWAQMLPNNPNDKAKELDAKGYPASEILKRYFALLEEKGYKLPRAFEIN